MITSTPATRNQFNTSTGNILFAVPQFELGSSPTSYIPRANTVVTRAADVIRDNLNLSVFRLYGSRDFTGRKGDKGDKGDPDNAGATGATGPAGAKGDKGDPGSAGATGATGPAGAKEDKGNPGAAGAT